MVTGVQTCALPILKREPRPPIGKPKGGVISICAQPARAPAIVIPLYPFDVIRSADWSKQAVDFLWHTHLSEKISQRLLHTLMPPQDCVESHSATDPFRLSFFMIPVYDPFYRKQYRPNAYR